MNGGRRATTRNLGFLLAKATQRWNEVLAERFAERGFAEVRPSYGSVLVPLLEEDGLRMGELAARSRLAKQTMTTLVRLVERDRLVVRRPDPQDGRAARVHLTDRARDFRPIAEETLAELDELVEGRLGRQRQTALQEALQEVMSL
ncbi:MAG: MarR family winged helix-turn-helix transcriptional regulator [Solirubrobacterales bacterium]